MIMARDMIIESVIIGVQLGYSESDGGAKMHWKVVETDSQTSK